MRAEVQRYYGEVLQSSADLKTNACCTAAEPSPRFKTLLSMLHDEVVSRYYGCGLVLPPLLEGCRVLDLGCGAGRDCYLLSAQVGEEGRVVGVDMTAAQLEVANRHRLFHAERFGHARSNVEFHEGDIERLAELGLEAGSFHVIVSNCVVNLAQDKRAVLQGAWDLLSTGGELYFADVYADRRVPDELRADPVLYGECLSGALYWNDFLNLAKGVGFSDPRLVAHQPVVVEDARLRERLGPIQFYSATYRLFRLEDLEPACEDYGQSVTYRGGIPDFEEAMILDAHHVFPVGQSQPVCGNTWRMLRETRFAEWFDFHASDGSHRGIFPGCGAELPFTGVEASAVSCC